MSLTTSILLLYVGTGHNPTKFETQSERMDYEKQKIIVTEKW